jgi:5,10-methylenetetrahydromethanopterin reductase
MVEFWLGTFPIPGRIVALAEMAEGDGWDGLAFTDSQNLGGDVFAALGIAAHATRRITLATGATNPATRHPAVLASAIATIQVESGGRAFLGIARGDSAVAYIGRKPLPLAEFATALGQIRAYLRGEPVDVDGYASQIQWINDRQGGPGPRGTSVPPAAGSVPARAADAGVVPMSVAATGPKVIALAAGVADAITFSVGADVERLTASIALARRTRATLNLPPLRFGAYLNAVAHPDIDTARNLVRGRLGVYARFSTMDRNVRNSLSAADRGVADNLVSTYDMRSHAASGARHEAALVDDFVDRFGIVGPSPRVAERIVELVKLGLDHVVIVGHSRNTSPDVLAESSRRFCQEVIPAVKEHALP